MRPEMGIRRERVRPPEEHEIAGGQPLAIGPDICAHGHLHPDGASGRTNGTVEFGRTDGVEKPAIHRRALNEPHRSGVGVRKNGFGAIRCHDRPKSRGNIGKRVVPTGRFELPAAFWADASKRRGESVAMIGAFEIPIHLGAEKALGERMVGVALYTRGAAVFDGDEGGAGVGAIVWAGATDNRSAGVVLIGHLDCGHRALNGSG